MLALLPCETSVTAISPSGEPGASCNSASLLAAVEWQSNARTRSRDSQVLRLLPLALFDPVGRQQLLPLDGETNPLARPRASRPANLCSRPNARPWALRCQGRSSEEAYGTLGDYREAVLERFWAAGVEIPPVWNAMLKAPILAAMSGGWWWRHGPSAQIGKQRASALRCNRRRPLAALPDPQCAPGRSRQPAAQTSFAVPLAQFAFSTKEGPRYEGGESRFASVARDANGLALPYDVYCSVGGGGASGSRRREAEPRRSSSRVQQRQNDYGSFLTVDRLEGMLTGAALGARCGGHHGLRCHVAPPVGMPGTTPVAFMAALAVAAPACQRIPSPKSRTPRRMPEVQLRQVAAPRARICSRNSASRRSARQGPSA
jgi:hypothetical protein